MDQSRRRTDESRLMASKRTVSIVCGDMRDPYLQKQGLFLETNLGRTSGRFYFISFYANRQRSLDRIDGDYQCAVPVARDQNAFQTVKRSAPDAHALSNLEERMRRPGQGPFDHAPNRIDFPVRNRCALASRADEPKYSVQAKNAQAVGSVRHKLGKHVVAEQRHLH